MTKKVQVGYNRRFYDFVPDIKERLSRVGLKGIEVHIPEAVAGIANAELVKHLFLQNSSHVIDLLFYLLGEPAIKKVDRVHRGIDHRGIPNGYNAFFLINDVPVHLIANWNSPSNFGLRFHADDVLIELLPIELATVYQGFEVIEPTADNPIRRYKPLIKEQLFIDVKSARFKPGFLKQTVNFFETCVLGNYPNTQASTLKSALNVTKLCEIIMGGKR